MSETSAPSCGASSHTKTTLKDLFYGTVDRRLHKHFRSGTFFKANLPQCNYDTVLLSDSWSLGVCCLIREPGLLWYR